MDRTLRPALVAEAIGTFIFFTVGAGAVVVTTYAGGGGGLVGVALAHGLVLARSPPPEPLAASVVAGLLWRYVSADGA